MPSAGEGQAGLLPSAAGAVEDETQVASGEDMQEEGKKKREKPDREIDVKGRVYVRNTIRSQTRSSDLDIASARIGAKYRDREHDLRLEVEAELAEGRGKIRDAHVRIQLTRRLRVQVGRFKRPVSAIYLTSRWDLPVVERGSLNDFQLTNVNTGEPDELPLGGRAVGMEARFRDKKLPLEPELTVGVFRSVVHEQLEEAVGINRKPLDLSEGFPEDVFGRLEVEPLPWMKAAASLAWVGQLEIAGTADSLRHGFVTGLDVVVERGPLRLWVEGFLGQNPYHLGNDLRARGRFLAARTIAAMRLPLRSLRGSELYIEPYVIGQRLDISSELDEDVILQGGGGVNLGLGDAWKVQLAVDHLNVGRQLYGAGTLYLAQLAAAF